MGAIMTSTFNIKNFLRSIAILLGVCMLLANAPANSQEITGGVVVNVTDSTGAAVVGAKLTLTNTATNDNS